jgi:GNAT superfamily N-acetyltransferase
MTALDRSDQHIYRQVQDHVAASARYAPIIVEQVGTVDVLFHPDHPDRHLNCARPHGGIAAVQRRDLAVAFGALEQLGRSPRLVYEDALVPPGFRQQIEAMGLALDDDRALMVYRPVLGPDVPGETPRGRLSAAIDPPVTVGVARTPADLSTWLWVARAGYDPREAPVVDLEEIEPLIAAARGGQAAYVLASYTDTPLGAARVALRPPTAELEIVTTAPLWHGMGLEAALVTAAVRAACDHGCDIVFTVAPTAAQERLYHRLGFVPLTRILSFCPPADFAGRESWPEGEHDEPDLVESLFPGA